MGYIIAGVLALITFLSISLYTQTERLDFCKKDHSILVAEVANKEEKSALDSGKKELEHAKILGDTNVEYQKKLLALNNTIEQLRKQRNSAGSSNLPTASNSKSSCVPTEQICFDRAELTRAESESEAEIEEIVISGTATKLDYTCAVDWVSKLGASDGKADIKD